MTNETTQSTTLESTIQAGRAAERKLGNGLKQQFGLSYPQYETLKAAAENTGLVPIGAIADAIGCSRGNLTGVCDRLERDGWLVRDRSKEDRRVVHIRLVKDFAPVEAWVQQQN